MGEAAAAAGCHAASLVMHRVFWLCCAVHSPQLRSPQQPALPSRSLPTTVTSKVKAAVGPGGSFAKVTLPELKAFLKSIKQPVGGKKGELEERVRAALGGGVAATVAGGAAEGPA